MRIFETIKQIAKQTFKDMEEELDKMIVDMQSFISKVSKKILKKEDILYIEEPKEKENISDSYSKLQERDKLQKELRKDVPKIKINTIENAIDQYLKSLYYIYTTEGKIDSYNALIKLSAIGSYTEKEDRGNKEKEKAFISEIKNNNGYRVTEQSAKFLDGRPCFYHIRTRNSHYYNEDENSYARLYLNLKRENVVDFSKEFMNQLQDKDFYFKISSDEQMEVKARSEKIVVYCHTDDFVEKVNAIRRVQQNNPKLVEKSILTNPFLDPIDGYIAYAPEPTSGKYVDRKGNEQDAKSFNDFLSKVLLKVFTEASKKIVKVHPEIIKKGFNNPTSYDKELIEYMQLITYVENYPEMEKYNEELIEYMKQELKEEEKRNSDLGYIRGGEKYNQIHETSNSEIYDSINNR